jgi:hypothetical protein
MKLAMDRALLAVGVAKPADGVRRRNHANFVYLF